jgi:hypothetical protein
VARRFDPWAALLLGVLLALGVVILLATPGPWNRVVGPSAAVRLEPPPPRDVAVFVLGAQGAGCSGVVWVHLDHAEPSLTAVVVAPDTQVFVPGGGFAPLRRVIGDAGPRVAAGALGETLGVTFDAWVTVGRPALRLALESLSSASGGHARVREYRSATAAWEGRGRAGAILPDQYRALAQALPGASYGAINVVAFANYILGFGYVVSDLDLQGATSLATSFKALVPAKVYVQAMAAVVETSRGAHAWRVDRIALVRLQRALEAGTTPPLSAPRLRRVRRPARVLVISPAAVGAEAYVSEVRRSLGRSAGAPIAVRSIIVRGSGDPTARVAALTRSWRPLAVLVAPPLAAPSTSGTERAAATLRTVGEYLRSSGRSAVMSGPMPLESGNGVAAGTGAPAVEAAVEASGLPVSDLAVLQRTLANPTVSDSARAAAAARANVQTLVRACWSGVLAPDLVSTRLAFGFAASSRTQVAVFAPSASAAARSAAALRLWGYRAQPAGTTAALSSSGAVTTIVAYRQGKRRAALALAGDLGLRRSAVVADDGAPAALTVKIQK